MSGSLRIYPCRVVLKVACMDEDACKEAHKWRLPKSETELYNVDPVTSVTSSELVPVEVLEATEAYHLEAGESFLWGPARTIQLLIAIGERTSDRDTKVWEQHNGSMAMVVCPDVPPDHPATIIIDREPICALGVYHVWTKSNGSSLSFTKCS